MVEIENRTEPVRKERHQTASVDQCGGRDELLGIDVDLPALLGILEALEDRRGIILRLELANGGVVDLAGRAGGVDEGAVAVGLGRYLAEPVIEARESLG